MPPENQLTYRISTRRRLTSERPTSPNTFQPMGSLRIESNEQTLHEHTRAKGVQSAYYRISQG